MLLFYFVARVKGSAKGSVNIDNRINRYWKGSVNRESNPGGTTEDLGCEPRCPNDTSAIKRGDRRSQSVQSRSHALLLPLLWIRTKQDPVSIFNRFYFRYLNAWNRISSTDCPPFAWWMLIERLATISNICWEVVCTVTCECGLLEAWIELFCVHVSHKRWILSIFRVEITLEITEKLLRVDRVLFW